MPELEDLPIGGSRSFHLAVLSIDVRDFTLLTLRLDGAKIPLLARIQALYLSEMSAIIRDNSGVTEKYTGDGVMGLFGTESDTTSEADVRNAMNTALTAKYVITKVLNPYLAEKGLEAITCGMGIDHGTVLVERVGLKGDNQFSLAGPTASLAAKMQGCAKDNEIFVGKDAYDRAPGAFKEFCKPIQVDWKYSYPVYWFNASWKE